MNKVIKFLFLLFLLLHKLFVFGQLNDDFTDGNFTVNPTWFGNTSSFTINASNQLQLDTLGAATKILYTDNSLVNNTEWQFWLKLNFDPSANNLVKIYLASDNADLNGSLNGYYIKIGENLALDGIDLYRQNGTNSTVLINGINGHGALKPVLRIKVIHTAAGDWELYSDTLGGTDFSLEGSAIDTLVKSSSFFGVVCKFTSSYAKNFYFDDFYAGNIIIDTSPPKIKSVEVLNANQLLVGFDEIISKLTAEDTSNYRVNSGINFPSSAAIGPNNKEVTLNFTKSFQSGSIYKIFIENIEDIKGNKSSLDSLDFHFYIPSSRDIVINEIFPDPSPSIGLPDAEFIELYNTSGLNFPIDLNGWTISDATSTVIIPDCKLSKGAYLILCSPADTSKFKIYGQVVGVPSFPGLNNDGDKLTLKDDAGEIIDDINYTLDWYHDDIKKDGGWTIERIDPFAKCSNQANWKASDDPSGGTPGKINSVYATYNDINPPVLLWFNIQDSTHIALQFSELIDSQTILKANNFTINNNIGNPSIVTTNSPLYDYALLTLSKPLENGTIYKLEIKNLKDCPGNFIKTVLLEFGLPEAADSLDLVINEILFNPKPNGYDFVEIYNRSNKFIDCRDLKIASLDDSNRIKYIYPLTNLGYQLYPKDYLVLTENKSDILSRYYVKSPEKILVLNNMPSFNDDEGRVVVLNKTGHWIDYFHYFDSYHFALLDNKEGVSLERLNPDQPTNNPSNWTSASSSSGYATPTFQNSEYTDLINILGRQITLSPAIFSPDNDGFQDEMKIMYHFDNTGNYGSITIYDLSGREVRKLVNNELFSTDGFYTWDGIDKDGKKAQIGVYIVFVEIVNPGGSVKKYKLTCTLAGKG
jgi:hypothetical protein